MLSQTHAHEPNISFDLVIGGNDNARALLDLVEIFPAFDFKRPDEAVGRIELDALMSLNRDLSTRVGIDHSRQAWMLAQTAETKTEQQAFAQTRWIVPRTFSSRSEWINKAGYLVARRGVNKVRSYAHLSI